MNGLIVCKLRKGETSEIFEVNFTVFGLPVYYRSRHATLIGMLEVILEVIVPETTIYAVKLPMQRVFFIFMLSLVSALHPV